MNTALNMQAARFGRQDKDVPIIPLQARAPSESEPLSMFARVFNLADIQELQDHFANATGVASLITDPEGRPITRPSNFCRLCNDVIRATPKGLANCMCSDALIGRPNSAGPNIQPCISGGLIDGGVSIYLGDQHIANWLIGQVLDGPPDDTQMMNYATEIDADKEEFRAALSEVTQMSRQKFEEVAWALRSIASMISQLAERNLQQAQALVERQKAEQEREALQRELIEAQQAALREISTPLIPVAEGVVIMPLIGAIDSRRASQIMESLLEGVSSLQADIAIIDITGVKVVDTQVAAALLRAAQAVKLLGARVVLTGISPEVAQTLVQIGADLSALITKGSLQSGIAYALGLQ